MKNLITFCAVAALILAFSSTVNASITVVNQVDESDGQSLTYFFDTGGSSSVTDWPYYRWLNDDWGWTHTYSPPAPLPASIISATLEIRAYDVDDSDPQDPPEHDVIFGGGASGVNLGYLTGSSDAWSTTSFTLPTSTYADLMNGDIYIWMDIDAGGDNWAVTLDWAKLTITYQPIPAPGAILLGSIGVGLVGWLRRRRTL